MASGSSPSPRRIEWTGERCVPWTDDLQVIYEHYQRYLFVAPLATGRRVLDLASGEGYGTAILAAQAQSVLGIDIDADSVLHASEAYPSPNVHFQQGDMLDLSGFEDEAFDLVVCFEALEHVEDHERLLDGVTRVLSPGGTFVVSTPDRLTYSEDQGQENPFHVHELSRDEFGQLLGGRFEHVRMWGQNVSVGSLLMPLESDEGSGQVTVLTREGDRWIAGDKFDPTYLVAIASDSPLAALPAYSTLIDPHLELVRNALRQRDEAREGVGQLRQAQSEITRLTHLEVALRERILATQAEVDRVTQELNRTGHHAAQLEADGAVYRAEVERLQTSLPYRLGASQYRAVGRVFPPGTGRRHRLAQVKRLVRPLLSTSLGVIRGTTSSTPHEPVPEPATNLSTSTEPQVSIIIPVHDGWEVTSRCLRSLERETALVSFEVIVVDDASTDETSRQLSKVGGVRVLRLEHNQGFLHAVNAGAAMAKGSFIVLLNNDVVVQAGWLDALVQRAQSADSIGIVGARLVYPDGRLQEAGGIIWSDATGCNYGRYRDPGDPPFTFRRDVDYCSGACLLVRRDLWEEVGGFDSRFAPAYYEDADLAFGARRLGYRVVYEPRSTVVHDEGTSYGTDESPKKTRLMNTNREAFRKKWSAELGHQLVNDGNNVRAASWRRRGGHVLVVDHQTPTFDQDAGSLRMFELLGMLTELEFAVTFIPFDGRNQPGYTEALEEIGVEVLHGPIDMADVISDLASDLRLVVLSRPRIAWGILPLVRDLAPGAKIIYDTVDLHFLRERRRAELEEDGEAARIAEFSRDMELWLANASDVVFVVSEDERELVTAEAPQASVHVIPTVHRSQDPGLPYEEREGLLFVGSFNHPPNRDAVEWLTREILPIVRRSLPDVPMSIVGSNPTDEVKALAGHGVDILGWVPDLRPLYARTRLFVAPLRYGAGIRGKIGESAAYGLPVVSTSLGAEGLKLEPELEILLADGAEAFAAAVVRAYNDPDLWWTLASNSGRAIASQCSPSVVNGQLESALEDLGIYGPSPSVKEMESSQR